MRTKSKAYQVDTQPTKKVIVDSLTRDISVEACIFDLIDNSIDAARNCILAQSPQGKNRNLLPTSYGGYAIKLELSGQGCVIEDNCGGIPIEDLKNNVLRFGLRSAKTSGIGVFGVGLNRAVFKLGRRSNLKTDTGSQRSELVLINEKYLRSNTWDLTAKELPTKGKPGTIIEILQPSEDIARFFSDSKSVSDLRHEIGRRYGRFISKGLSIAINKVKVIDEDVKIRRDGPYEAVYKTFTTRDGVAVFIEFGQHIDHRFSAEPDSDEARNRNLTKDFGWTILCNDRAIVMSDRTSRTGWYTKFHSEFYGFVGSVMFVSKDPAKLPWTTTKTDIDANNTVYRSALEEMQSFAKQWRDYARDAKNKQRRKEPLLPTPAPKLQPQESPSSAEKPAPQPAIGNGQKSSKSKPTLKPNHNQLRTILPADVDEKNCKDKLLTLVHEAKILDLSSFTYAGLGLIRTLFEVSVWNYLVRQEKFEEAKEYAIARREKSGDIVKNRDKVLPNFEETISFLENTPSIWGSAKANHLKHALHRLATRKKRLNSAVHNPIEMIHRSEAFQTRDDVLPLLRHLIEN